MLVLFHKPYGVLSQFTSNDGESTLADYIPLKNIYAAGRLDKDSEGLLLLTDDGQLQHKLTEPEHTTWKRYWVQVEGTPSAQSIKQFQRGVELRDGITRPAKCKRIPPPPVGERNPPVRFRRNIPTQWLEVSIAEGRNRQIRRMTAAIGHPTLRLIRVAIGQWQLSPLKAGEYTRLHHAVK